VIRVWIMNALCLISTVAAAQVQREFSHPMHAQATPVSVQRSLSSSFPMNTLRVLAIMVDFQADVDEQTTGDGTFQLSGSADQIDPPPHDTTYFKNKIRFVENYFRSVSNGVLTIQGRVLDRRITLWKTMKEYSPPTSGNDNQKLAQLASDSWKKADTLFSTVDFSQYDLFVIFHAGAGRDIDLVSSTGTNPTPHDIPSLYLDSAAFAHASGINTFSGISVNGGTIKNTIILPETESRVIAGVPIELGINGLFAASIGSYLGLPDLFDTKTGRPGIGRFGLMDGASIFAYGGLFPVEPCAWEKIRLGWAHPKMIDHVSTHILLPAVGLHDATPDSVTIYKIPISQSEYFLLENRNRDPENNGQRVTLVQGGRDTVQYFETDVAGFRNDDVAGIHGSVVDVEDFDWSMVGEKDGTGKYDGGGIVIWHIDENVIQSGLQSNTVNADRNHRGVDVMEADGSKDIGQNYDLLEPGYGTENGSPLDCWFNGNSAVLYTNVFDRFSFPNSNSYSGAASLIAVKEFSARMPYMTAVVESGTPVLRRNSELSRTFAQAALYPTSTKNHHLYLCANDSLFAFQSNGQSLTSNLSGVLAGVKATQSIAVLQQGTTDIVASVHDSSLNIFRLSAPNAQGAFDSLKIITHTISQNFSSAPCIVDSVILVGTEHGDLYRCDFNGTITPLSLFLNNNAISTIAILPASSTAKECFFTQRCIRYNVTSNVIQSISDCSDYFTTQAILAAATSPKGNFTIRAEKNGNRISLDQFDKTLSGPAIQELAIADINGDGEKDIIVQSKTQLSVFSRQCILLDGFPVQAKVGNEFTGIPLIIDFNGDGQLEIICFTNDGEMWVYNRNGKVLAGFPILVTSPGKVYPMAYTTPSDTVGIAILSETGALDAFLTSTVASSTSMIWTQNLADENHTNADWSATSFNPPQFTEFMPKARVYNWPNPVYGRTTQIRYYTTEDAAVTVTILDLSGVKITELKGRGTGGMDSEIVWDVSNIQSGVYLARIDARGLSKSETAIIKIAVVK
jgi:M6 family metalloprotease-like protein